MRKKTFFKFIFVSLISVVGGAGMFLGFITYVIPRLVVLVPEPNINLSDIGVDLSRFNSVSLNGIIAIKENNYGTSTHDRI